MRRLVGFVFFGAMAFAVGAEDAPRPFASFDLAGPSNLNDPHDLAFGPDGKLYVADKFGSRIVVLDPETLEIERIVADGLLPGVHDVSFGPDGRAAVAVTALNAVIVFDRLDVAEPTPQLSLAAPRTEGALMHSNGRVYATASALGAVLAYEGYEIAATAVGHPGAHDIAEDKDGNVWVADNFNRQLVKYTPDLTRLQSLNHAKFGFVGVRYMDFDDFGRMVVADQDGHRLLLIDPDGPDGGSLLGVLGTGLPGKGPGLFDDPEGIAVHEGRYFISDSDNNRIVRYAIVIN